MNDKILFYLIISFLKKNKLNFNYICFLLGGTNKNVLVFIDFYIKIHEKWFIFIWPTLYLFFNLYIRNTIIKILIDKKYFNLFYILFALFIIVQDKFLNIHKIQILFLL